MAMTSVKLSRDQGLEEIFDRAAVTRNVRLSCWADQRWLADELCENSAERIALFLYLHEVQRLPMLGIAVELRYVDGVSLVLAYHRQNRRPSPSRQPLFMAPEVAA